jgi:HD superfamily phosphodiesterase
MCFDTAPAIIQPFESYVTLWDKLSTFVADICSDRDASHGHLHMMAVATNALKIYSELRPDLTNSREVELVMVSAWVHDVIDHKYIESNLHLAYDLNNFLTKLFDFDLSMLGDVMSIVTNISFSKEKKIQSLMGEVRWEDFLPAHIVELRHIVSDADKLEAIGMIGIHRCKEYITEQNPLISLEEINKKLLAHANEKLLLLATDYIRTDPGKKMAKPLHDQMMTELNLLS